MFSWFLKPKRPFFGIAGDISTGKVSLIAFRFFPKERRVVLISHHSERLKKPLERRVEEGFKETEEFIRVVREHEKNETPSIVIALPYIAGVVTLEHLRFLRPHSALPLQERELTELMRHALEEKAKSEAAFTPEGVLLDGRPLGLERFTPGKEVILTGFSVHWRAAVHALVAKFTAAFGNAVSFVPRITLLRDYFLRRVGEYESGVLFDIDEEESALLVFYEGELKAFQQFPFGAKEIRHAVRPVIKKGEYLEVDDLWTARELVSPDAALLAHQTAFRVIHEWENAWREALLKISQEVVIVPKFYLAGASFVMEPLLNTLTESNWFFPFAAGETAEVSVILPHEKGSQEFLGWPVTTSEDAVIFSVISRMIQTQIV